MTSEIRDESGLPLYICQWNGKRVELRAESSYRAQQKAVSWFTALRGRKKVRGYDIFVTLVECDGEEVVHGAGF